MLGSFSSSSKGTANNRDRLRLAITTNCITVRDHQIISSEATLDVTHIQPKAQDTSLKSILHKVSHTHKCISMRDKVDQLIHTHLLLETGTLPKHSTS